AAPAAGGRVAQHLTGIAVRESSRHPRSAALVDRARARGRIPAAVIYPCSAGALAGALEASIAGLIAPVLIGPRAEIEHLAAEQCMDLGSAPILEAASPLESVQCAAE